MRYSQRLLKLLLNTDEPTARAFLYHTFAEHPVLQRGILRRTESEDERMALQHHPFSQGLTIPSELALFAVYARYTPMPDLFAIVNLYLYDALSRQELNHLGTPYHHHTIQWTPATTVTDIVDVPPAPYFVFNNLTIYRCGTLHEANVVARWAKSLGADGKVAEKLPKIIRPMQCITADERHNLEMRLALHLCDFPVVWSLDHVPPPVLVIQDGIIVDFSKALLCNHISELPNYLKKLWKLSYPIRINNL